jgi:arylsulfatase A-like enzyme
MGVSAAGKISFVLFSILVTLFALDCSENNYAPGIAYDLVRELTKPTTKVTGIPSVPDPIPYHWKKNPGRQSRLPIERKWENTQITFNTDKELFVNHSLDAIYLSPNSSYSFKIESGLFDFRSLIGGLGAKQNTPSFSGTLRMESNGKLLFERIFQGAQTEKWESMNEHFTIDSDLKISWQSEKDHFFLAEPVLYAKHFKQKPNVILIVIDSARKDFFGSYGFPYPITPNMDALAKESVVFENPFANGNWTKPSMMSFFHSDYSSNLGLGNSWFTTKPYQRKVYYGKKRDNLTSVLRDHGYYTKSIMNNVFFLDYTTVGIDLGFHNTYQVGMDILDTKELTDHAIDFLKQIDKKPFFLHFNLNTPHASYSPPPEDMLNVRQIVPADVFYKYESPVQRYMGEMLYTDREIGRLIQSLKSQGIYEDTMIVLTGDHGELFGAHHDYSYHFIMKTRFGHGETHYDEEINVPYFIKLPKSLPTSKSLIKGQSSLLSLLPTIVGLLGLDAKGFIFRGIDYSKCIITREECPKEDKIYTEGRMSESVRTENYKYIRRYPGFTNVSRKADGELHPMQEELYDLLSDPEERINLSVLPEGVRLLAKAREDFQEGNFLNRNQIHVRLPACSKTNCLDIASLSAQGSFYYWQTPTSIKIQSSSAKSLQFEIEVGNVPIDLVFHTVNPEMEGSFVFRRNGSPVAYRLGKWGIETPFMSPNQIKEFILSDRVPLGWESSPIPWVYNDGSFSGTSESTVQREMGKEVKKILETWGYIHE